MHAERMGWRHGLGLLPLWLELPHTTTATSTTATCCTTRTHAPTPPPRLPHVPPAPASYTPTSSVTSVLAIGGIGGLAIGLAGREICENILNGFLIMSTVGGRGMRRGPVGGGQGEGDGETARCGYCAGKANVLLGVTRCPCSTQTGPGSRPFFVCVPLLLTMQPPAPCPALSEPLRGG